MDSVRQYDPQKPRRERNLSREEWQQYMPHVEGYRQDGVSLKDIVKLLRTEHGLTISYKRLTARIARQNARHVAATEAVGYEASDNKAQGDAKPIASNSLDTISSLKERISSLEVEIATEARSKTSRIESKIVEPQYHVPVIHPHKEPLAQSSTTTGSTVPAYLKDPFLADLWAQLIEIVSSDHDLFNILLYPFVPVGRSTSRVDEIGIMPMGLSSSHTNNQGDWTEGYAESESYHLYQMADCYAALGLLDAAFTLYLRGLLGISQIGIRQHTTVSRLETLVQYLLWGIIGCCRTCSSPSRVEHTVNCLDAVRKVLAYHNRTDAGTRMILSTYRALMGGQEVKKIQCASLEDLKNYRNIFDSLHPAIRLREAHFMISIALHPDTSSLTSSLATSLVNEICVDLHEQILAHASINFPACVDIQGFLQTFAKAVGIGDPDRVPRIHPCPRVLLLCTRLRLPFAKTGVHDQLGHYCLDGFRMWREEHADEVLITREFLVSYLASLQARFDVFYRLTLNRILGESRDVNTSSLTASDEGNEHGLLPVEPFTDTSSVSTDSRAFRQTARRARVDLENRKAATKKGVWEIEERFSSTMSISSHESWQFHRVTNLPQE